MPFLSKCHHKGPQRSSCGSNILPQRSSCAFIMQLQRISCSFQDSSSSDPQSAARRTSSCGRKKKFLRLHYFWVVLYIIAERRKHQYNLSQINWECWSNTTDIWHAIKYNSWFSRHKNHFYRNDWPRKGSLYRHVSLSWGWLKASSLCHI